ncbi:DUF2285 domain-containing protein [Paenalcaligenes niemegkensis]|uniref:DUF2285 domain-containing protein n=1 Tax=Paenalcaligenes niemegkensis TaxID=2895469 RepID=UPI001EE7AAF5|nr:DUF2285 domain-containing protein [Paenalcaligenes niemegkensis]MCQ9617954.1 DUF2285 domain-containing protein [Paenalcaligenes niemegkensis]
MADPSAKHWYPTAAYLYVLHLDGLALAWEYLRRHPDYRRDWLRRRRQPGAAERWGLRVLEDPGLDARNAHPAWFPDHDVVVQLYPDADPPPDALVFEFWCMPGDKHLVHDGKRLVLTTRVPGYCVRLAFAPDLDDGMAYVYAIRACATAGPRYQVLVAELDKLVAGAVLAVTKLRPSPASLLELHTLQALDATLAGASLREAAEGLFGIDAVAAGWYTDGGLRSKVRRLVRRGKALMSGGYRRLAQLESPGEGRSARTAKRP